MFHKHMYFIGLLYCTVEDISVVFVKAFLDVQVMVEI